jgi:hypothetical protein
VRLGREFALDELKVCLSLPQFCWVSHNKHGDASATDLRAVSQGKGPATTVSANAVLPLSNKAAFEEVTLDTVTGTEAAFRTFPMARSYARLVGVRSKRSQAKAAEVQAVKE